MRLSKASRCVAALIALVSIVFAQTALAWYQCPGMNLAGAMETSSANDDSTRPMPDCDGMDLAQPSLCQAHAQSNPQSLDKPHPPDVPVLANVLLAVADDFVESAPASLLPYADSPLLKRITAPPISIRHCCFRI